MKQVGAYEAKTHLSKLLDQVEGGESITITRHGAPVAVLQPAGAAARADASAVIEQLKAFRGKHLLGGLSLRRMIEEGRR